MIPPITPGQAEGYQQNMVGWKNTFNMRHTTLMNLAASHIGLRNTSLQELALNGKGSAAKSLDLLRRNLQSAINKDIDNVIKKYLDKFFQPAINNIRINLGKDSVNGEHIKDVCMQMLEEAKSMYRFSSVSPDSSPYECSDSESGLVTDAKKIHSKRKDSDPDFEPDQKRHKPSRNNQIIDVHQKLPVKRDGPKWDPNRITTNSLFIMGAKANKVLGYGQTRGRLYVRHPELLRYSGDQEDKEWLAGKNLMPPSGGKAYLMLLDDIKELTQSDEYRNSPHLQLHELKGFEVPQFLLNKIRFFMEQVRTDKKITLDPFELRHSITPPTMGGDSAPSTPSDTLQLFESQSVSSKHSDNNFIHITEMSPGSNNSFMSSQLTQSPISTTGTLLSPNMMLSITNSDASNNNGSSVILQENARDCLSSLFTSQISSDNSQEF